MNSQNEKQPRVDLFIYSLPFHVSREFIRVTFEAAGFPIAGLNIVPSKKEKLPGVRQANAFVMLDNPEQKYAAIKALHNFKCGDLTAITTRYKTVEQHLDEKDHRERRAKARARLTKQASSYRSPACESWARHQAGETSEVSQ